MTRLPAKVVMLHAPDSDRALENLNRITGLRFSRWPESLALAKDDSSRRAADRLHGEGATPAALSQALA